MVVEVGDVAGRRPLEYASLLVVQKEGHVCISGRIYKGAGKDAEDVDSRA